MPTGSDTSLKIVGLECEALEGASWGTGRIVLNLIRSLAKIPGIEERYRFVCYSNNPLAEGIIPDHPAFVACPVGLKTLHPSLPSSFSVYYYLLLPLHMWRTRPSLVYFANYMLPVFHPPRVTSLVMLTDDIFREANNPHLPIRFRLAYKVFATGWAKRRATAIHAISYASASTLEKLGVERSRIVVNPLGIPAPREGIEPENSSFLFVGQAFERRRLRESLRCFERLATGDTSLTFRIIGVDKYRVPTIGALVDAVNARLGRRAVVWSTYESDAVLASAYAGARALMYVSDSEAFGLPPLEALSYGVPPVVADIPVMHEIYGDNAFYVAPPYGENEIERSMRDVLNDSEHGARIRSDGPSVAARYTWDSHAGRFLDAVAHMI